MLCKLGVKSFKEMTTMGSRKTRKEPWKLVRRTPSMTLEKQFHGTT
jgi:hypothetical protein